MATLYTDESVTSISSPVQIPSTDYIGNSLATLNTNFDTLYQDILFLQKQIANIQTIPAGTIAFYVSQTAPTGWISCDGSVISNTLYPVLYNLLGTTYGSTKGTLPDLRGQFIRGWNNANTGSDASRIFGKTQADAFKSHTHTDKGHAHQVTTGAYGNGYAVTGTAGWGLASATFTTTTAKAAIQNTGDAETRPTNIALLGCIKT
jgi:microcystin-dependent protein